LVHFGQVLALAFEETVVGADRPPLRFSTIFWLSTISGFGTERTFQRMILGLRRAHEARFNRP